MWHEWVLVVALAASLIGWALTFRLALRMHREWGRALKGWREALDICASLAQYFPEVPEGDSKTIDAWVR